MLVTVVIYPPDLRAIIKLCDAIAMLVDLAFLSFLCTKRLAVTRQ